MKYEIKQEDGLFALSSSDGLLFEVFKTREKAEEIMNGLKQEEAAKEAVNEVIDWALETIMQKLKCSLPEARAKVREYLQ